MHMFAFTTVLFEILMLHIFLIICEKSNDLSRSLFVIERVMPDGQCRVTEVHNRFSVNLIYENDRTSLQSETYSCKNYAACVTYNIADILYFTKYFKD